MTMFLLLILAAWLVASLCLSLLIGSVIRAGGAGEPFPMNPSTEKTDTSNGALLSEHWKC